jgi:hypothetical protein
MRVPVKGRIGIHHITTRGRGNGLRNNHTDNQAVNTQDTRHDNGDNILDNTSGVINPHVADA